MCGRYYSRAEKQAIAERFKVKDAGEFPIAPDFNIAPTTFQPVVRLARDSGQRELTLMRWGLVPNFAKSLADFKGFSTFNARAESLSSAATWRTPFQRRRCLVPADGFYEWMKLGDTAGAGPKAAKKPFAISLTNAAPMAFAGLYDVWKDPAVQDAAWLLSFTIVTTEANEIMASIHNRMPVILHPRDWAEWLEARPDRPPPTHLLRPFDSDAMRVQPCNPLVGNVRNNGEEMLAPAPALNSA